MGNSIIINTTTIKDNVNELDNDRKYYSNKKAAFSKNAYGSSTKLVNYLAETQEIYTMIAQNIASIKDYLNNYVTDIEGLENGMSGGSGNVGVPQINGIISKLKNSIKNFDINPDNLFEIIYYNGNTAKRDYDNVEASAGTMAIATAETCTFAFLEGIINVGEMLVDGGAMIAASTCSIIGLDDQANAIGEFVKEDWSKDAYYRATSASGADKYIDPDGTAANICSMAGNIAGMVGLSVLTGGAAASIFGAETAGAATVSMVGNMVVGALSNTGSEGELALKRGATLNEAEAAAMVAGAVGLAQGAISGALDYSARATGAAVGKQGMSKICKYALAAFGVGSAEPLINEAAQTVIYRNDNESGFVDNFMANASEDGLLLQMALAGGGNALGTLSNGLGGIKRYNSLSKQIEDVMNGQTGATVIELASPSEISPDLMKKITDPSKVVFKIKDGLLVNIDGSLKQIDGSTLTENNILKQAEDAISQPNLNSQAKNNSKSIFKVSLGNDLEMNPEDFMKLSLDDKSKYLARANIKEINELLRSQDMLDEVTINYIKNKILNNQESAFFGKVFLNRNRYIEKLILASPETYDKLSNSTIITLLSNNSDAESLLKELYRRIDLGENVFSDNYGINDFYGTKSRIASKVYYKMNNEYIDKVYNKFLEVYKLMPDNLKEMSRSGYDFFDQANMSRAYQEGKIDEKGVELLSKLYTSNKNIVKGMNFDMLNQEYIDDWGETFLTSIINDTNISNKIAYLHDNNPDLYNALLQVFKKGQVDNSLYTLYPKMINMTNFIFDNQKNLINIPIESISEDSLINYVLYNSFASTTDSNIKISAFSNNYNDAFNLECDKKFNEIISRPIIDKYFESDYVEELKRVFYNKYFSNSPENIKGLIAKFETSLDAVKKFDPESTQLIDFLKYVETIEDIDTLSNLYKSMNFKITPEELLSLDDSLRSAYAKTYVESLTKTDEALRIGLESSKVSTENINGKDIKIINAEDKFSFIVRSSDSGLVADEKQLVENSYIKSWYQTDDPSNHILAASFITDENIGTCPVNNDGVLYGFTRVKDSQIAMISLSDLNSNINSVGYSSNAPQIFVAADEMSNYTRRIYNEIDLEIDGVTPDYIIAYSDFTDKQLENAYKAAAEWNIPVVKIDKVELATRQADNINNLMNSFKQSNDTEYLKKALDLYESNCSGYKLNSYVLEGKQDLTSVINNKTIYDLGLFDSVKIENDIMDYIQILSEKESNYQEVENVIKIFENIKYKYNLANANYNDLIANTKSNLDIDSLISMLKEIRK